MPDDKEELAILRKIREQAHIQIKKLKKELAEKDKGLKALKEKYDEATTGLAKEFFTRTDSKLISIDWEGQCKILSVRCEEQYAELKKKGELITSIIKVWKDIDWDDENEGANVVDEIINAYEKGAPKPDICPTCNIEMKENINRCIQCPNCGRIKKEEAVTGKPPEKKVK